MHKNKVMVYIIVCIFIELLDNAFVICFKVSFFMLKNKCDGMLFSLGYLYGLNQKQVQIDTKQNL